MGTMPPPSGPASGNTPQTPAKQRGMLTWTGARLPLQRSTAALPAPERGPVEQLSVSQRLMNDRFLRACRREPVDVTPVWFMRQAGRYMSEYRALRQKHTLLDICRTPELALEVTLQPLRAHRSIDAAILFADILLPLTPMGAPFDFAAGEGPVIFEPIRDRAAVEKLRVIDPEEGLGYVLESVRLIRQELDGKTP